MRLNTNSYSGIEQKEHQSTRVPEHRLKTGALVAGALVFFLLLGAAKNPKPAVYIKFLKNSRYQLMVANKPYIVKGVFYKPIPSGQKHEY